MKKKCECEICQLNTFVTSQRANYQARAFCEKWSQGGWGGESDRRTFLVSWEFAGGPEALLIFAGEPLLNSH